MKEAACLTLAPRTREIHSTGHRCNVVPLEIPFSKCFGPFDHPQNRLSVKMLSDAERQAFNVKEGNTEDDLSPTPPEFVQRHRTLFHAAHVFLNAILLVWPWVFAGVVWAHHGEGGIGASSDVTSLVLRHPRAVDFFVTTFTAIMAAAMTYVFTTAVMFIYRDRFVDHPDDLFVQFFRYVKAPPQEWPLGTVWSIISNPDRRRKGLPLLSVLAFYSIVFTLIGPGLNALLIPHPFSRTTPLRGTELDFSSNDASCLEWINANPIPISCNWRVGTIVVCAFPETHH
jgi:hypothetical protein